MMGVPWWVGTLIGTVLLIILNVYERSVGFGWGPLLLVTLLATTCSLGYWYGFYFCENYVFTWFLGSGLLSAMAVLIHIFWFKGEVSIPLFAGAGMVAVGLYLLSLVR